MSKPIIAFFGATGGCGLSVLHRTISAGYTCTALARDASKVKRLLGEKGVSEDLIKSNLTVVEGNAKDQNAVEKALLAPNGVDGTLVDIIVCGLGGTPKMQVSIVHPVTLDDPNICADATSVQLKALENLLAKAPQSSPKPLYSVVSTTGISAGKRDVPIAFAPLYHWLLSVPHEDKKHMEQLLEEAANKPNAPVRGVVVVRPALLMDGEGQGMDYIHQGTSDDPAVGYTITRDDVGLWIFEKIIKDNARDTLGGKKVSLTASSNKVDAQGH